MSTAIISDTLASTIRIATPLLLMALGGLLCQRAGVFNIALEGFSLIGAFAAIAVVQFTGGNVWLGLLGAAAVGAVYSSLYALFVTRFKADHIIASIAMNTLAAGMTSYLLRSMFEVQGAYSPDNIDKLEMIQIPVLKNIPILNCLSGQSIMTYFAIAMVAVIYILLFRTKAGPVHLRGRGIGGCGQNSGSASGAGTAPGHPCIRGAVRIGRSVSLHDLCITVFGRHGTGTRVQRVYRFCIRKCTSGRNCAGIPAVWICRRDRYPD